jgi:hypothetical protein
MKNKTIVEFIEEGTNRVIRSCSIEEYNNMIESYNNLIPYKHLKEKKIKVEMVVSQEDMDIIKKYLIK